jgi:tellurite resistance protein TerC
VGLLIGSLNFPLLGHRAWHWLAFAGLVISVLIFDLRVVSGNERATTLRKSTLLSMSYIAIALLFGSFVWWQLGSTSGVAYFSGYLIEKLLSVDNLYVIATIFSSLAIPSRYHHRVLFWGILGAVQSRALLIGVGATLVSEYSWVLYLFGTFVLLTGVRIWISGNRTRDPSEGLLLRILRRPLHTTELKGNAFFVHGRDPDTHRLVRHATPLFVALCLVELADVAFSLDSIPAVFAITTDPFVRVYEQYFCNSGFALALLPSRRHREALRLLELLFGAYSHLHRRQGVDIELARGSDPGYLADGNPAYSCRWDLGIALEGARSSATRQCTLDNESSIAFGSLAHQGAVAIAKR